MLLVVDGLHSGSLHASRIALKWQKELTRPGTCCMNSRPNFCFYGNTKTLSHFIQCQFCLLPWCCTFLWPPQPLRSCMAVTWRRQTASTTPLLYGSYVAQTDFRQSAFRQTKLSKTSLLRPEFDDGHFTSNTNTFNKNNFRRLMSSE
jgi:hypothetical protein